MSGVVPAITGIGLVTSLGTGVTETFDALLAGRYIEDHARTLLDATSPDRVHNLAIHAADQALREAGWTARSSTLGGSRGTALVVGTSKGAVEAWITAPPGNSKNACILEAGSLYGLADISVRVRERFPLLDGPSLTVAGACAGGLLALVRGLMMLRTGEADRVLVVAAEASVHPLFVASFDRLGVMPRPGVGCRPFDRERDGFMMSEAAAAVCLENVPAGDKRTYPRVANFALGSDAVNMTAGDADGAVLRNLLGRTVGDRPLDLVHAHGTGTQHNDPIELAAYEASIPAATCAPFLYSHKGALGHSLGAAGLVAVVLSCVMHARSLVLPSVRIRNPLPSQRVRISGDAVRGPVNHSVCVASGFGGPTAVVSLVSGGN